MRVSAVGWAFESLEEVLAAAVRTADVTHNHQEGYKGAMATAAAIYMARTGSSKEDIRKYIEKTFKYNLSRTIDEIRPKYHLDVSCQGSVPEAIICFLDSSDYENTIRNAVSLGGDSDTQACIAGGIAEAYYKKIPKKIITGVKKRVTKYLWAVTEILCRKYGIKEVVKH